MSFLDRIAECNVHDLSRLLPFMVEGHRVGWIRHELARRLDAFADVLRVSEDAVVRDPALDSFAARSLALDRVLRQLAAAGVIGGWRDEPYPVATAFGAPGRSTNRPSWAYASTTPSPSISTA